MVMLKILRKMVISIIIMTATMINGNTTTTDNDTKADSSNNEWKITNDTQIISKKENQCYDCLCHGKGSRSNVRSQTSNSPCA